MRPIALPFNFRFRPKYFTFDRSIIKRNWRQINEGPLKRAGLLIRRIARNSIRRRPYRETSRPGAPPFSHKPGKSPPFKQIYSVPNYFGAAVVIGMVGYGGRGSASMPVPGLHEHGGRARRWIDTQYKKKPPSSRGRILTTAQKQAIYKKKVKAGIVIKKSVPYKERPFMTPALKNAAPKIPAMWRGSVGGRMI